MEPGRTKTGEESADREVDQQLIVRRRGGAVDPRDPNERDARNRGADHRHVVPDREPESADEALSRDGGPIADRSGLDPRTALEGEKRGGVGGPHDDGFPTHRPEAQDLRAHDPRPRLPRQILHEALVDGVRTAPLRHEVCVPREDARRDSGEGREDRPGGPEEEGAQE